MPRFAILDAPSIIREDEIEQPHHLPRGSEYLIELPKSALHYELDYSDLVKVAQSDFGQ